MYKAQSRKEDAEVWRKVIMDEDERQREISAMHDSVQGEIEFIYSIAICFVLHRVGSHLGRDKTYAKLRQRFYWPLMQADVRDYIQRCDLCQRHNALVKQPRPPMTSIPVSHPDPWRMVKVLRMLTHSPQLIMSLCFRLALIW